MAAKTSGWLRAGAVVACLLLAVLLGGGEPPGDPPPAPSPLARAAIERQLAHLRELVEDLREARPDLFPGPLPGDERPPEASDEPLQAVADRLGKELSLLEATVAVLTDGDAARREPFTLTATRELTGARGTYQVDLPPDGRIVNSSLELANVGRWTAIHPRLVLDGRDWHDVHGILADALGDATEPAEQARRLWSFLVEHRLHAQPASGGIECHDPVKLLDVYGYGLCDDAANVFAELARAAGLQARVWGLGGHVVPEVRYDGAWHMYDADHEVLFLDASGSHVASVEELAADPDLLDHPVTVPGREPRAVDAAKRRRVFASTEDNALARYPPVGEYHAIDFVLRPDERVVWHFRGRGERLTGGWYGRAAATGDGDWIYERALDPDEPLPVEVPFSLPWPVLDGRVELLGPLPEGAAAAWSLQVRIAGSDWCTLPWQGDGDGPPVASLAGVLRNGAGVADYGLELRLLPAGRPDAPRPAGLRTSLIFQVAPASLPALHAGLNEVAWSCDEPARLRVLHRYREESSPASASRAPGEP